LCSGLHIDMSSSETALLGSMKKMFNLEGAYPGS